MTDSRARMAALMARERPATMRWLLLVALHVARPEGLNAEAIRPILSCTFPDVTDREVLRELQYLADRELVQLREDPLGQTYAKIDRYGVDVVEYSVEVDPGINRPKPV